MTDWTQIAGFGAAGVFAALVAAQVVLRRRRERRDVLAHASNVERGLHLPPSLHPVIDTDICIGSLACLKACPEGDILGIIDGAARLVHATQCIGHGQCAAVCPVGAIKLVFGTAERGVDLPELDERFESSRPGVHVVGELGGMGLIRNAVEQGTQCARFVAESLGRSGNAAKAPGAVDVAIVGAGPAGLATALGLQAAGVSFRLIEQGVFGGTVANYPRQKVVMTEPLQLPGGFKLRTRTVAKEELLSFFGNAARKGGVVVDERTKVIGLSGDEGAFTLQTDRGAISARKVVLATGRRGSPRKLGVPGEDLEKVTYGLTDPEQYEGARVLVAGGGDSAVEAACALAEQGGCEVALTYRGAELSRCRPQNRARAEKLAAEGTLTLLLGSEVKAIDAVTVQLSKASETITLPNEYVIACLGGELPLEFLKTVGVQVRRQFGAQRPGDGNPARRLELSLRKDREQSARSRRRLILYALAGVAIIGLLWAVGSAYYPLPRALRMKSPLHSTLRSAGAWGHGIGIGATAVMLFNFLYVLRKRWRVLGGLGTLRGWLDFHVFVGFLSPAVIAFHAAFQSNNLLASGTSGALAIVVGTGFVGRFFYGLIPGGGAQAVELADLLGQLERLKERLLPLVPDAQDPAPLEAILARASRPPSQAHFFVNLVQVPLEALAVRLRLVRALPLLPAAERAPFRDGVLKLTGLHAQVALFGGIKRLMRVWRTLHASLAVLLVLAIAAHVAVSLYLGYGLGSH